MSYLGLYSSPSSLSERKKPSPFSTFNIVTDGSGRYGVKDRDGNVVVGCKYINIEMTDDGFACCYNKRKGRYPWIDLKTGWKFRDCPVVIEYNGMELCTEDGVQLLPRVRSRLIDNTFSLNMKTLDMQVGSGLSWRKRFISWTEPDKVYEIVAEKECGTRVLRDEHGGLFVQENPDEQLIAVNKAGDADAYIKLWEDKQLLVKASDNELVRDRNMRRVSYENIKDFFPDSKIIESEGDGIVHVVDGEGRDVWIDMMTCMKHFCRPVLYKRGFVELLKERDMVFIRNIRMEAGIIHRNWEIKADDNICTVRRRLYLRKHPFDVFTVKRRSDDFSYFLVETNFLDGMNCVYNMKITNYQGEKLKCTKVTTIERMQERGDIVQR